MLSPLPNNPVGAYVLLYTRNADQPQRAHFHARAHANNYAAMCCLPKRYGKEHPRMLANKDSCAMAKEQLVQFFARQLLNEMGGEHGVDIDGDGHITEEEVSRSLASLYSTDVGGSGDGAAAAAIDGASSGEGQSKVQKRVPAAMVELVMKQIEEERSSSSSPSSGPASSSGETGAAAKRIRLADPDVNSSASTGVSIDASETKASA